MHIMPKNELYNAFCTCTNQKNMVRNNKDAQNSYAQSQTT